MTHCRHCSRPLTRAESVALGVGPVCAGRVGVAVRRPAVVPVVRVSRAAMVVCPEQCEIWAVQLALPGV